MDQPLPQQIDLQVVTPERRVVSETVTSVSLPGRDGRLGILPGHAPLVSELAAGVISYEYGGKIEYVAVSGGFTEVLQGRVIVLAETAERAEEIDAGRAQRAKLRAEEHLRHGAAGDPDAEAARASLARALVRLEAAQETPRTAAKTR
ncbi:MAG: F0F1 ATP synthase subunit epsilon [Candidatus Acidiferrales bacterium]